MEYIGLNWPSCFNIKNWGLGNLNNEETFIKVSIVTRKRLIFVKYIILFFPYALVHVFMSQRIISSNSINTNKLKR